MSFSSSRFAAPLVVALFGATPALAFEVIDTGIPGRNEVYWLDDTRILFPGFERRIDSGQRGMRPVLYVWDYRTKRASVHAEMAEGGYVCYSGGQVRYAVRKAEKVFIREGKFGAETEREWTPLPADARIDRSELTCRDIDLADLENVYPGFIFVPLRDKDGYYGWKKIEPIKEALESPLYYLPAGKGKKPMALAIKAGQRDRVSYSEFLKAYVIEYTPGVRTVTTTGKVWFLHTNGKVEERTIPAGPWLSGSVGYTPAKNGIVMSSPAIGLRSDNDPGASGVYLVSSAKVERMVAGYPTRYVGVSPDGCRAAAVVRLIEPTNVKATLRVIDVCNG